MAGKKDDRRVRRTLQQLSDALHSLIRERSFEALTVQDIIDRANVGRSTFYAHFPGKEQLLVYALDQLRSALAARQHEAFREAPDGPPRLFAFSHELFAHAYENRDIFRAMVGKRGAFVVQRRFQQMIAVLLRDEVKGLAARAGAVSAPTDAVASFLAGGLYGLLEWWTDGQMRLPVEEVNALFRRLAIQAVKATRETDRPAPSRPVS